MQDTPVIMKSQHLEMAESLNSSILHLPGDNEAHGYMLVERTTEVPTPIDDVRTRGRDGLASNSSIVSEG